MIRKILCIGIIFTMLICTACSGQKEMPPKNEENPTGQESETVTEKKPEIIVLQDYCGNVELLQLLADAFQNCHPEYEIRIDRKKEGMISGWSGIERDVENRLQKNEMPDLMLVSGMPEESFCKAYCQTFDLDIQQEELIGHVAISNLSAEGWLGVPILFSVETMAISEKHGISYKEWTNDEMMRLAQMDDYQGIVCGRNGYYSEKELVTLFGNDLTLQEETFVKEHFGYGDTSMTVGEIFHKGKALAFLGVVARVEDYKFINSLLEERAEFVGLPSAEGGKNKLSCMYLYPGKNAKQTKGSKRFMEYALSKEGQDVIQEYLERLNVQSISVRRDVVEDYIERNSVGDNFNSQNGVTIKEGRLSEKELEEFWRILESAE